jgi:hypothetical protein
MSDSAARLSLEELDGHTSSLKCIGEQMKVYSNTLHALETFCTEAQGWNLGHRAFFDKELLPRFLKAVKKAEALLKKPSLNDKEVSQLISTLKQITLSDCNAGQQFETQWQTEISNKIAAPIRNSWKSRGTRVGAEQDADNAIDTIQQAQKTICSNFSGLLRLIEVLERMQSPKELIIEQAFTVDARCKPPAVGVLKKFGTNIEECKKAFDNVERILRPHEAKLPQTPDTQSPLGIKTPAISEYKHTVVNSVIGGGALFGECSTQTSGKELFLLLREMTDIKYDDRGSESRFGGAVRSVAALKKVIAENKGQISNFQEVSSAIEALAQSLAAFEPIFKEAHKMRSTIDKNYGAKHGK